MLREYVPARRGFSSSGHSTTAVDPELCRCEVSDGDARWPQHSQCSRKRKPGVVRPVVNVYASATRTLPVCGFHASVYDRAKEREEQRRDKVQRERGVREHMERLVRQLADHGVQATVHHSTDFSTTGKVVVDPVAVLRLLGVEV